MQRHVSMTSKLRHVAEEIEVVVGSRDDARAQLDAIACGE